MPYARKWYTFQYLPASDPDRTTEDTLQTETPCMRLRVRAPHRTLPFTLSVLVTACAYEPRAPWALLVTTVPIGST